MPQSDRQKISIDSGWLFYRGDINGEEETHQVNQRPWQKVDLPHEWSIEGPFSKENNTTQGFLPMGIGWYKKGLHFPKEFADKKLFLLFDGVYRESDVWMNYAFLGHHTSGYTSFAYDITDYVRTGNRIPNGLRVRVDARRHEEDMYEGCGIYRHVWLVVTNKLHIANWGTFVYATDIKKSGALVHVKIKIKNEYKEDKTFQLITKIVDAGGKIVAEMRREVSLPVGKEIEIEQSTQLKNPHLWELDDPYLYKACTLIQTEKVVDAGETKFGIRTFRFDANKGFFLNGRHVKLRGFNGHYDFAGLGTAIPDRIQWNAMMVMKKAGFNFYRSSHNPATPERLEVCDEIGMLVWDEVERKLESADIELPLVRETITRDRNHPSVILWSLENESPLESTVFGTNIIKQATALAHQLDPTRPTTFAASMPVNKNGYGAAADVAGYNYHWERADADHLTFPDWKIGLISEYSAARSRRGVYGIENSANENFDLFDGMVKSMYDVCTEVENSWQRIKARDYLGGGCIWAGIDYWGEGTKWPVIASGYGTIDMCLFSKDVYYYFVSQWTKKPMVHIFPHWTWPGKEGQVIDVWGYTNCDEMELFVDDRSLGAQRRPEVTEKWKPGENLNIPAANSGNKPKHLVWHVPYQPGTLTAVGKRSGKVVCRQEIHTAGKPARIALSPVMADYVSEKELKPLVADGRDVIVIKAEIRDKNGNPVPTADNPVQFEIQGEGEIVGVGNGDIASHEPNKVTYRKAYNGLCAAIVRSGQKAGEIVLTAKSAGLKEGRITIQSVAAVLQESK
ncbi:MAG: DUF4982 domain-containing protein [Actinobacteria bacterium]|nr:DUF4982 domain-containing protein [Actinomycetota bacterium]